MSNTVDPMSLRRNLSTPVVTGTSETAMTPDEQAVERVARAIEGPREPPPPGCVPTLDELREIRWKRLSTQEQGERRWQARAAIAALAHPVSGDVEGLVKRLREFETSDELGNGDFSVCENAADMLEALARGEGM